MVSVARLTFADVPKLTENLFRSGASTLLMGDKENFQALNGWSDLNALLQEVSLRTEQ